MIISESLVLSLADLKALHFPTFNIFSIHSYIFQYSKAPHIGKDIYSGISAVIIIKLLAFKRFY